VSAHLHGGAEDPMPVRQALPCASFVAAILLIGGCGGSTPTLPAPPVPSPVAFASHASANFVFRYTAMDAGTVAATAAAVEAHHARSSTISASRECRRSACSTDVTVTTKAEHYQTLASAQQSLSFVRIAMIQTGITENERISQSRKGSRPGTGNWVT
jgi:hypothetical protein